MLARLWSGSVSSSRSGGCRNLASRAANVDYPVPPLPVAMKIRPAPSAVDVCRLSLAASAMMRAPNSSSRVIPLYPQRGADPPEYLAGQPLVGVLFAVALPQVPASATHVAKQIPTLAGTNMSTDKRPDNPTRPQNAVNKGGGGGCVAPPKAGAKHPFAQGRFFGLLTMDGSTVAE